MKKYLNYVLLGQLEHGECNGERKAHTGGGPGTARAWEFHRTYFRTETTRWMNHSYRNGHGIPPLNIYLFQCISFRYVKELFLVNWITLHLKLFLDLLPKLEALTALVQGLNIWFVHPLSSPPSHWRGRRGERTAWVWMSQWQLRIVAKWALIGP